MAHKTNIRNNQIIGYEEIVAPREICLYSESARAATLKFLNLCDESIFYKNKAITVNLSQVEEMTAAASVLLLSTISRAKFCGPHSYPSSNVMITLPTKKRLKGELARHGFIRAISCNSIKDFESLIKSDGLFVSGNDPKKDGRLLSELICKKYGISRLPNRLSAALSESLLNVLHHAYSSNVHEFMTNRWWCCFDIDRSNPDAHFLQCVILDRGAGIPYNIRNAFPLIAMQARNEGDLIAHAMKTDVTSTTIPGRGQGSEDMKHPVVVCENDDFISIQSMKGEYIKSANSSLCEEYSNSVGGTLIEWRLAFHEQAN